MKNRIRLTESQLHKLIKKAVNEITVGKYNDVAKNYEELWGVFLDYLSLGKLETIIEDMRMNVRYTKDPRFKRAYELIVELNEILEHVRNNLENAKEKDFGFDEKAYYSNSDEDKDIEDYEINDLRKKYPLK